MAGGKRLTDEQAIAHPYGGRLAAERRIYADKATVHDLPPIFHYWTRTHVKPMLEGFGFSNPDQLFLGQLERAYEEANERPAKFASLGAGNCDLEVRLGSMLRDRGLDDFELECLDLNEEMLARGRSAASAASLERNLTAIGVDLNHWQPHHHYDCVIANQAMHHMVNLEGLLDTIGMALPAHGRFVASDMIGRNGHLRWPEALAIVQEFWQELPRSYRQNLQLGRVEEAFEDWDCSGESFEGIRAQDILPALLERFDFELFVGFGNVIDPFVDRSFGPHFDPERDWDRDFIDRVHRRDEAEIHSGAIKPTHMLAVMRKPQFGGERKQRGPMTPEFCVRPS